MSEINKITYEEIYQEGFKHGLIYKNKVNKELESENSELRQLIKQMSEGLKYYKVFPEVINQAGRIVYIDKRAREITNSDLYKKYCGENK